MSDKPNTYKAVCDVCGDAYPATEECTVQWANAGFCSRACKQHWQNAHQPH